ncbi:Phosducin-like protein [Armadillidium vulgare]|nr:Phosducin-like protein [Armadillidium vulgare]
MATLEDRLLGEKTHYYCSSSEDEDENEDGHKIIDDSECAASYPSNGDWDGSSMNTGPKGVIKDWQRFKQLETEQRREQEKERVALAKKLAITCRSHNYIKVKGYFRKQFGEVLAIGNGEEFLDAVDKEDKDVTVIIHVFESGAAGCEAMNGCLLSLAKDYPDIKFCRLHASDAGLSRKFQGTGVPALLVYKGGQMLGNFVRLTDEFGEDFFASDVEAFLIEHGILLDRSILPPGVKSIRGSSNTKSHADSDSD